MRLGLTRLAVNLQCLTARNDGQDLVEYALLISLISVAVIAGSEKVASAIIALYSNINSSINAALA